MKNSCGSFKHMRAVDGKQNLQFHWLKQTVVALPHDTICYDCCIYALIVMFVTLMLIFEISRASFLISCFSLKISWQHAAMLADFLMPCTIEPIGKNKLTFNITISL